MNSKAGVKNLSRPPVDPGAPGAGEQMTAQAKRERDRGEVSKSIGQFLGVDKLDDAGMAKLGMPLRELTLRRGFLLPLAPPGDSLSGRADGRLPASLDGSCRGRGSRSAHGSFRPASRCPSGDRAPSAIWSMWAPRESCRPSECRRGACRTLSRSRTPKPGARARRATASSM